jgi:hypothetical protein
MEAVDFDVAFFGKRESIVEDTHADCGVKEVAASG